MQEWCKRGADMSVGEGDRVGAGMGTETDEVGDELVVG